MKCKFIVGQRVACIKTGEWSLSEWSLPSLLPLGEKPSFDEVYTVARLIPMCDGIYLALKELRPDFIFHHSKFRPVPEIRQRAKQLETA